MDFCMGIAMVRITPVYSNTDVSQPIIHKIVIVQALAIGFKIIIIIISKNLNIHKNLMGHLPRKVLYTEVDTNKNYSCS